MTDHHAPTPEQAAIADGFGTGQNLAIEAGAGAGKTSTLRMLAEQDQSRRGVYIAFNRAIAADAKHSFPARVQCATAHSLAFRAVGRQFKHRLNGSRLPARETARILGINEPLRLDDARVLAPEKVARLAMASVRRFCYSADAEIDRSHVPKQAGFDDDEAMAVLRQALPPLARRAWDDLTRTDGRLRFAHDHYLKMWQLSGPKLPCDYVLLDEAQDANPVVRAIFEGQNHAQQVAVGDTCQQIYAWRGAVDALATFDADVRLPLSQSFRFGEAVAGEANKWLSVLDSPLRLSGFARINSAVEDVPAPEAVLTRTNAEAIAQILHARVAGRRPALAGGGEEIRRLAEAAAALKAGARTDHPELFAFANWGEVQDYVDQDGDGSDLKTFVTLIDEYGPDAVIDIVDGLSSENRADVVVSTAHKAKGREWGSVRIAADFRQPQSRDGEEARIPRADGMLAYVAVTRARYSLDRDGLAWIDQWLPTSAPAEAPACAARVREGVA